MWTYFKALWTWTRWTVQSLFLPRDKPADIERPGTDDQFHEWNEEKGKPDG